MAGRVRGDLVDARRLILCSGPKKRSSLATSRWIDYRQLISRR